MRLFHVARAVLAFGRVPATILLVIIYVTVFISVFCTDKVPPVPGYTHDLDLEQAWLDLHQVLSPPFLSSLSPTSVVPQAVCSSTPFQFTCQRYRPPVHPRPCLSYSFPSSTCRHKRRHALQCFLDNRLQWPVFRRQQHSRQSGRNRSGLSRVRWRLALRPF